MSDAGEPSVLEVQRLKVLQALRVAESPPEQGFDALVRAAKWSTGCSMAMLTAVEADAVRPLASTGGLTSPMARADSLCGHVVSEAPFLEVTDTRLDARFAGLPPVVGEPHLRFYASVPVRVDGEVVASLCVMDGQPRRLTGEQRQVMVELATVVSDLMVQRRARLETDDQLRRLHDLASASGDWMWELDRAGRCVWISGNFEGATGMSATEVLGRPLAREVLVDYAGEPQNPLRTLDDLLQARAPFSRVLSVCDTATGRMWLSRSALPVFGPRGEFLGFRGTARNMTASMQAERQRRSQDERLQRLSAEVPGALVQFVVGAEGGPARYRYVSAGLSRWITPVSDREGEVCPLGPADDIVPADLSRWNDALAQALRRQRPLHVEYRMRRRGSAARWFETRASAQRMIDGSTVFYGFTADVTERYALEASRQENHELRRDKSAAEEASRAKSAFLSRASHELRTPLNAVVGFAQLMAMDQVNHLPPEQAHRLDGLRSAGQRLLDLVNDLLDVARIESGALHLRSEAVDATGMVASCLATVRPMAASREVRLRAELPQGVAIQGDTMALEQVLINLLSNAIKYNRPEGEVIVDVVKDGTQIVLSVSDEGAGLDDTARAQLFQPFNRLGAERRRIEGSGLGLVIVKELVQAMGGQVSVHSRPEGGTRFEVCMPAADGPGQYQGRLPPPVQPPLPPCEARRHILYVEDEPLNVLLMQEVIRTQPGWTLHVAPDGQTGLALARELDLDLALIDMNLPDLNGVEVLQQLRADPRTASLCCVALSADALAEQIATAKSAGFDDYWTKPIDLSGLVHAIGQVLSH